ncbi:predicted protein [Entamoeba histolytica]
MEELINKNNKIIKEVVETLPNIQQSIDDTTKKYQYYIGSIRNEVFEIKDDETYSEAIKRGEGIFDRIDETERRRKLVIEKSQETINQIEIMKNKISRIIEECNNDEETLSKTRNELIDKIISIEEMIMKDKVKPLEEEINKITSEFNKKKEEWENHYSDYLERKKRKDEEEKERKRQEEERKIQEEERLRRESEDRVRRKVMKETMEEIQRIEEWTNRKVGNILFDSDIDDWNVSTSVFIQRIINKEHIIIIIEDEEGNKFGGYVNEKIDKVNECINDSKSFVFSLESNGRMKVMKKFDIKKPQHAFWLCNQSDNYLFKLGNNDIVVFKENNKTISYCKQHSFSYKGITNALCGKQLPERFTPKRIIVIEMK